MDNQSNNNNNNKAAHAGLTPSQAMKGKPGNNEAAPKQNGTEMENKQSEQQAQGKGNRRRPNRRRRGKKGAQPSQTNEDGAESAEGAGSAGSAVPGPPQPAKKNGNRRKGKPKGKQQQQQKSQQNGEEGASKQQGKKGRNRKPRKRYPWRRSIPPGTVDPITLENLNSLPYPPFALVASAPYVPVPVWPVPEGTDAPEEKGEDIEELNRRRLQEQWGGTVAAQDDNDKKPAPDEKEQKRYYNLFDGRALAYYLVSQLQFIDPLNRRDLTRDELLNLDDYLRRHGFKDLRVTEAYDAKGITLSSAGAAASTAQGRADIMQQMARNLLNALFGGNSVGAPAAPAPAPSAGTSLRDQYQATRAEEEGLAHRPQPHRGLNPDAIPFDGFGAQTNSDGGLAIIDDDENPGARGGNYSALSAPVASGAFYSAAHITGRYGSGAAPSGPDAFPALPTPPAPAPFAQQRDEPAAAAAAGPSSKPSKTLARIAGAVKKTDPEEQQRQWEAREIARKKAMLSKLTFGVDAAAPQAVDSLPRPPQAFAGAAPQAAASEGLLQRNKALAEALGVKPATARQQINSGWARPTDGSSLGLDEFGNELTATIYPDALILEARERVGLLLKLEKKWKSFLMDDAAASIPLNPMDRPARKFVHHYSDFWSLRTESFDPEPRRYIHCVKMLDTHTPRPLLSEAARNWRGPSLQLPTAPKSDHASHQTAGQTTKSREVTPSMDQSFLPTEAAGDPLFGGQDAPRFASLAPTGERQKLELAKRSLPLELPPYQPEPAFNLAEDMKQSQARREEKERKKREAEELKRRALENAFASDDDEVSLAADSGSEWEESEPLCVGDDED